MIRARLDLRLPRPSRPNQPRLPRPRSTGLAWTLALATGLACSSLPRTARAEPTTWLSVTGGVAGERHAITGSEIVPVFSAALGVGTDPNGAFSVGGLFRSTTYVGIGTELALGPRLATAGFTRGSFGFAFDLGVALRPYGRSDYGRLPLQGGVVVGFPWGVQLETGVRLFDLSGQPSALGGYVTLGIDLLRFTVHRRGKTEQAWPNPAAAGAPLPPVAPLPGENGPDDLESPSGGAQEANPTAPASTAPSTAPSSKPGALGPTSRPADPVTPADTSPEPTLR